LSERNEIWKLDFLIDQHPEEVKSVKLTNQEAFEGVLKGVKGQYLIFEDGSVMNIRSHEGFIVNLSF